MMLKPSSTILLIALLPTFLACDSSSPAVTPEPEATSAVDATGVTLFGLEQHDLYDGRFIVSGQQVHQVGTLTDEAGWDHMGNDGRTVRAVGGTIEIDVDELADTGSFVAQLDLPEGEFVVEMDRFHEFNPCQNGGIAAFLVEHGDSGCGDSHWPKSLLYIAGWGYGHATLNGELLYDDYEIHFMVTQGMRDRQSLATSYPLPGKSTAAGAVNPAMQQLDFFIRSPETDDRNHPNRVVFDHFFAMSVTWL